MYTYSNQVTIYAHRSRRNMTVISDASDTYIRHRFMGHYDIQGNYYGMRTFTEPTFVQSELLCLLGLVGTDLECPLPDIILINSGHHDIHQSPEIFEHNMRQFLNMVRSEYIRIQYFNVKIYWKGTLLSGLHETGHRELYTLDQLAARICKDYRIPYINATDVLRFLPRYLDVQPGGERPYQLYTQDRIHHGGIARSHNLTKVGSVSMLVTQRILAAICDTEFQAKANQQPSQTRQQQSAQPDVQFPPISNEIPERGRERMHGQALQE